jgi:transcriptional regulator with XRE-family HTH domain
VSTITMSEQLRQARVRAGLTLQQVANRARVSRPTVEKAEKGRDPVSSVNAARIVNALNELAGTAYTVEELGILTGR